MSTKAALKAAKAAIGAKKFDEAAEKAKEALSSETDNYVALYFLAFAQDKLGQHAESEKSYRKATQLKPNDEQAWLGLRQLYEVQGSAKMDEFIDVSLKVAELYAAADDRERCHTTMNKMITAAQKKGTKQHWKKALKTQLPSSPVYTYLEGRLPHPEHTYTRLAEISEEEEERTINTQIAERRTRVGARKDQVTIDVKREVYTASELSEFYQGIIDWTAEDSVRRNFEEKKFQRDYDTLLVVGKDKKKELRDRVMKTAHGMVIIKHPYELAWIIELEWKSVEKIVDLELSTINDFIDYFPDNGLAKVLNSYLNSPINPFPKPTVSTELDDTDSDEDGGGGVLLITPEDQLVQMNDGLSEAKDSPLAHRLVADYLLHLEEYESVVETIRPGLVLLSAESRKSGWKLQENFDDMNTTLATALIKYQTPRHHPEAKTIFEEILHRRGNFTPALLGIGLILEEEEKFPEALEYLSKALKKDPDNIKIGLETAWCQALNGDYVRGLKSLQSHLEKLDVKDTTNRDVKAETLYRIGRCQWEIDISKSARKDRKGAYANFLLAVKTNINHAPSYASLGIYYEDYGRDKKRARQCFQKAFDLSPSEVVAAERLARAFADKGDWDIVEVIAQRVVASGKARPPPGSNRKGISWPYSALGVVQMNRLDYQKAIVSFLAALRISPDDYHSYVGLGESYHNSGRYNSALRTFIFAEQPEGKIQLKKSEGDWYTRYMLANVSRELGSYDEAIQAYRDVLVGRKMEFGVEIALMQTLLERAWRSIETGFYGRAIESASQSLDVAAAIVEHKPEAFNLWRGVSDACSIFSWVRDRALQLDMHKISTLLKHSFDLKHYDEFLHIDGFGQSTVIELLNSPEQDEEEHTSQVWRALQASILAQKRALHCSSSDIHAQAVAWYNLGWTEYRAYLCSVEQNIDNPRKHSGHLLKASVRCFKRAIEMESGNAEFWNALGAATTKLNPKVAQHALARSLHLNERNPKAWANLGGLYLLHNDHELAHVAFSRSQSADPDFAHAWVGEGLVALLCGNTKEALLHFTHAFDISEAGSTVVKREFPKYAFDSQLYKPSGDVLQTIQPLFALRQLRALDSANLPFDHLTALYHERVGDSRSAIALLRELSQTLESAYEEHELEELLLKFVQVKSDLARNLLADRSFEDAITEATTTLDLLPDDDGESTSDMSNLKHKIRLSANMTIGLAKYYQQDMDSALNAFRAALEETKESPEVICSLAEVLWAKGGNAERGVAKEQLFESIGRCAGHVESVVLLGVMVAIEGNDPDTMQAVLEELEPFRTRDDLSSHELDRVERVLEAIHELSGDAGYATQAGALLEIQKSILVAPHASRGWSNLADLTKESHAATMALTTARRSVPPRGKLNATELSTAFASTGSIGNAQRSIMLTPNSTTSWDSLISAARAQI